MPEDYFEDASGAGAEGGASRYPETRIVRKSHGRLGSGKNPGGDRGRADSEPGPPTLYCPSCDFKATLFPSSRIWCPRCKTFSELRGGGSGLTIAAVMGVALLLAFVLFYVVATVSV